MPVLEPRSVWHERLPLPWREAQGNNLEGRSTPALQAWAGNITDEDGAQCGTGEDQGTGGPDAQVQDDFGEENAGEETP